MALRWEAYLPHEEGDLVGRSPACFSQLFDAQMDFVDLHVAAELVHRIALAHGPISFCLISHDVSHLTPT